MRIATWLPASLLLAVAPWLGAQTAQISFTTTSTLNLPSRSNFAGMNMDLFNSATAYNDTAMQSWANKLNLGWVRFPGGTSDDVYDWQTGLTPTAWVNEFEPIANGGKGAPGSDYTTMQSQEKIIGGKQSATAGVAGIQLPDFAGFIKTQGTGSSTHVIGVINTFTDTPASAAALVNAAVNTYGLKVDVWELGNEPTYFVPDTANGECCSWFTGATDYLNQVAPFASAIKTQVPSAKVAVWIDNTLDTWTQEVASYPTPFWDELYTHSYPQPSSNEYEFLDGFLMLNTNALVDNTLEPAFGNHPQQIEWSEYNINSTGYKNTLYNGVFNAEFAIRLSSDANVTNAGMHMLVGPETQEQLAIGANTASNGYVTTCKNDYPTSMYDTHALNFGYYLNPAGLAMELINGPINSSIGLYPTTVTNSNTVAYSTNGKSGNMPAIYAQAYAGSTHHVLLTNKALWVSSSNNGSQQVEIFQNGVQVTSTFTTRSIGGIDPTTTNSSSSPNNVVITTATVNGGVITVPGNSVMDVTW